MLSWICLEQGGLTRFVVAVDLAALTLSNSLFGHPSFPMTSFNHKGKAWQLFLGQRSIHKVKENKR